MTFETETLHTFDQSNVWTKQQKDTKKKRKKKKKKKDAKRKVFFCDIHGKMPSIEVPLHFECRIWPTQWGVPIFIHTECFITFWCSLLKKIGIRKGTPPPP